MTINFSMNLNSEMELSNSSFDEGGDSENNAAFSSLFSLISSDSNISRSEWQAFLADPAKMEKLQSVIASEEGGSLELSTINDVISFIQSESSFSNSNSNSTSLLNSSDNESVSGLFTPLINRTEDVIEEEQELNTTQPSLIMAQMFSHDMNFPSKLDSQKRQEIDSAWQSLNSDFTIDAPATEFSSILAPFDESNPVFSQYDNVEESTINPTVVLQTPELNEIDDLDTSHETKLSLQMNDADVNEKVERIMEASDQKGGSMQSGINSREIEEGREKSVEVIGSNKVQMTSVIGEGENVQQKTSVESGVEIKAVLNPVPPTISAKHFDETVKVPTENLISVPTLEGGDDISADLEPSLEIKNTKVDVQIQAHPVAEKDEALAIETLENEASELELEEAEIELKKQIEAELQTKKEKFTEQLNERIRLMTSNTVNKAYIQLDPPELGALELSIEQEGDKVVVQIQTNNAQAKEVLESQLDRLREMLEQQGLTLAHGDVSQQGQQQASDDQNDNGEEGEVKTVQEEVVSNRLVDQYV